MASRHSRCLRGERLRIVVPHGHWKTTTFVGALTPRGFIAPWVLEGPINRDAFETYVAKALVPELRTGDIVVMDNLFSHKGPRVRQMIEETGAELRYLPPDKPRLQSHRERLRQTQGPAAQGRRANRRGPMVRHRPHRRSLPTQRMSKLLQRGRI
jgi:hypothetical protein